MFPLNLRETGLSCIPAYIQVCLAYLCFLTHRANCKAPKPYANRTEPTRSNPLLCLRCLWGISEV